MNMLAVKASRHCNLLYICNLRSHANSYAFGGFCFRSLFIFRDTSCKMTSAVASPTSHLPEAEVDRILMLQASEWVLFEEPQIIENVCNAQQTVFGESAEKVHCLQCWTDHTVSYVPSYDLAQLQLPLPLSHAVPRILKIGMLLAMQLQDRVA